MTVEGFHAANALFGRDEAVERREISLTFLHDPYDGRRQEVHKMRCYSDGTRAGSAATVRDRERLVQVEVHHVEAQVARADNPKQRVEVRTVAVHQAAAAVYQLNDLFDVLIEETERVRVREHHANDRIVTGGFEGLEVHVAAFVRWDRDDGHAHHADRGGVRPMRRVGNQHLGAFRVAARLMISAHHQHTGEFSMRARRGLQRHCRKARDLFQPFLQLIHQQEIALHGL